MIASCLLLCTLLRSAGALAPQSLSNSRAATALDADPSSSSPPGRPPSRRSFLTIIPSVGLLPILPVFAEDVEQSGESDAFEKLRIQAAAVSKQADEENEARARAILKKQMTVNAASTDTRTIFEFTLPINGRDVSIRDMVPATSKAILVVNMKQDDPIARLNIPELIDLASKFKQELTVLAIPSDQGYYEPDTSELIRLKMTKEYGWGINPSCVLIDKINLLGTGAHPMMRWLQGQTRTPMGVGKIQANFEKFLLDGETGRPLRRYPRRYTPRDIVEDISALQKGRLLPPAGANFLERWREAEKEAVDGTYRFQKGLNVFDQ